MRKAKLIMTFIERVDEGDRILCEFNRDIDIEDVPPIGYTVLFPDGKSISRFLVESAVIQNTSGNMTLYSSMEIQRYENWDYDHSRGIIDQMKKLGWSAINLHRNITTVKGAKDKR